MFYGGGTFRNRYSVDERIIFERLWRGALCQALGANAPVRTLPRRQQCCCHCHCSDYNNSDHVHRRLSPKKTMRSVVR